LIGTADHAALYFPAVRVLRARRTSAHHPMPAALRTSTALALVLLLAACGGGDSGAPPPGGGDGGGGSAGIDADVVVQLRSGASVTTLADRYGLEIVDRFGRRPIWRLRAAAGADVDGIVGALRDDGAVQFAERNEDTETPEGRRRNPVWAVGGDAGEYASQWAPQAIRLAAAQTVSTGAGVRVAVLDTGIELTHPALAPKLARRPGGALLGRDFVDDDADPAETGGSGDAGWGHGTHVAGLVALVAPGARLMPVRVLDNAGRGNAWVLAEALAWAVDPDGDPATDDGAHVINLSLSTLRSTALLQTVTALAACTFDDDDDEFEDPGFDADRDRCARRHAAVVTAAAGNGASETTQEFPAAENVPGLLSVAASTESHGIADFSNRGSWIRVAAPGEAIVSTVPGAAWGVWSGTSMAAPLAAGGVALLLATLPPSGDPALPAPRQWDTELAAKRLADRSAALCDTSLRRIDLAAALADVSAVDPPCP
jgi:subtilisin family serine protease